MIRSRLKLLRVQAEDKQNRKLTLHTIAEESGLSYNTVSRVMNNDFDRIDIETLNKLCVYFSCGVGDLLEFTPD